MLSLVRDGRLRSTSHLDERCGGFFALGLAKASGLPVALACTSGTAAANYAPAVIEAHEARVPLIVLTADRPPELRDVGAGQTIDQIKLYGSAAKWFQEVDDHAATPERIRWLRGLACRAFWTALDGRPGPVHLNFSLREPLVLDAPLPPEEPGGGGRPGGRPWVARPARGTAPAAGDARRAGPRARAAAARAARRRPRGARPGLGAALAAFAERAGLPLLAEPTSGARRGAAAVAHYDALLRDPDWGAARVPELVLRFGDLPTSKPLRLWLGGLGEGTLQVAFDPESAWQDPAGAVATMLAGRSARRARGAGGATAARAAGGRLAGGAGRVPTVPRRARCAPLLARPERAAAWPRSWAPGCRRTRRSWSRPRCRSATSRRSSPSAPDPPRVLSNRGANGIDGTVSTAFGVAAAARSGRAADRRRRARPRRRRPARRAPARASRSRSCCSTTTAAASSTSCRWPAEGEAFERHVATPHGLEFAHAAALYGLAHEPVATPEQLGSALDRALAAGARDADPRAHRARAERGAAPRGLGRRPVRRLACRAMAQERLIEIPGEAPAAAGPARQTSKSIGAGDIVLVDKKGRRFHALVTELEQLESGRFELIVRPLDSRISYRTATVREVLEVWRKRRA